MGFRFRRSIKLLPGVRLNVGKTGFTSVSVGGRGNRLNFSSKGTRHTLGIPGTGVSYSTFAPRSSGAPNVTESITPEESSVARQDDLERFGVSVNDVAQWPSVLKWMMIALGLGGLAVLSPLEGLVSSDTIRAFALMAAGALLAGIFMPSRGRRRRNELQRCIELAHKQKASRVAQLQELANKVQTDDLAGLNAVLDLQRELRLTDEELGTTIKVVRNAKTFAEWMKLSGDNLPALEGHDTAIRPDSTCYFVSTAIHDKRGDRVPHGTLYFTEARAFFLSDDSTAAIPWNKVVSAALSGHELRLHRHDRQNPNVFWMADLASAMKAEFIAKKFVTREAATTERRVTAAPNARRRSTPEFAVKMSDLPIADERTVDVGTGADCSYGIVGESQRQNALRMIDGGRRRRGDEVTFIAELVREPDNTYDGNAVKVLAVSGEHLGYLPKDDAKQYQAALTAIAQRGKRACCRAKLIGGTEGKPSYGVLIDLRGPDELLAVIEPQPF